MSSEKEMSSKRHRSDTLRYYELNADNYFRITSDADVSSIYQHFLSRIPKGGRLLDAGNGSGRDTAAFVRRGYLVEAFDFSPALCELSTEFTGIQTRVRCFQDVDENEEFDGVWACASLLHVPQAELSEVINRLIRALKPKGVLFMSFKYGTGERVAKDGRYFVDMTEDRIFDVLHGIQNLTVDRVWRTLGEDKFEGQGEWLNVLVSKDGVLEKDM